MRTAAPINFICRSLSSPVCWRNAQQAVMFMDKLEEQASTSRQQQTYRVDMNVDYQRHENSETSSVKKRKPLVIRCVHVLANGFVNAVYGFLNSRLLM